MSEVVHGRMPAVLRRWYLLLLLTVGGGVIAYTTSSVVPPVYQATTSILVGQPLQAADLGKEDIETSQQLALTYADVVRRQPVLDSVVNELDLYLTWQDLRDRVRAELPPDNPQLIVLTVEAASPGEAVDIARETADQLVALSPTGAEFQATVDIQDFVRSRLDTIQRDIRREQREVNQLEQELALTGDVLASESLQRRIEAHQDLIIAWQQNYSSLLGLLEAQESPNYLQLLEEAEADLLPVRPDLILNTTLGAGVGLFLAIAVAYLLEGGLRRFEGRRPPGEGLTSADGPRSEWSYPSSPPHVAEEPTDLFPAEDRPPATSSSIHVSPPPREAQRTRGGRHRA